jgi:LAO/AO transport system kinase
MNELIESMLQGDSYALSRLITLVENDQIKIAELMERIRDRTGKAGCIGITGPPGAGKSSLTAKLVEFMRKEGASVGVIACDPSSPFSGGALLGDRIRMGSHFLDDDVFIRSMSTRGNLGGLPQKVHAVTNLLDAFGKDFILIETVGVGQTDVDIRGVVDTNVLVLTPFSGDQIQAMKSGIMEIVDIFVINKIDIGEPAALEEDLADILRIRKKPGDWTPLIHKAQSIEGLGVQEVLEAIKRHRCFLQESGFGLERHVRNRRKIFSQTMKEMLLRSVKQSLERNEEFMAVLARVERGEMNPYLACEEILRDEQIWREVFSHLIMRP